MPSTLNIAVIVTASVLAGGWFWLRNAAYAGCQPFSSPVLRCGIFKPVTNRTIRCTPPRCAAGIIRYTDRSKHISDRPDPELLLRELRKALKT
jgi:hypothetical protein